ncbi:MAG TPA: zf-TFIIB domain-containing protein [Dehalococcoidia bacterium]|nr:zf-TFIIB domain-containing protein [Dehalococcoidia bacterium]
MFCPRDGGALHGEADHHVPVHRCHASRGAWYDYDALAALEATVAGEDQRVGTIEFAKHESVLPCPVCEQTMHAFNYRAYNLELDACSEGHGWWLDAGESDRVRAIMQERVSGLRRAASAQRAWKATRRGGSGGVIGQIKDLFRGRR